MTIDSFKSLLSNPTFKTLAKAQAVQDDRDPFLKTSSMTRSPFQLLGLILLWDLTDDKSKALVIKQINYVLELSSFSAIKQTDLDFLSQEIDWEKISSELNAESDHFFKLELPKSVIQHLETSMPLAKNYLRNAFQESKTNECKVITTIQQNLKWAEPLEHNDKLWLVPSNTFQLSKGFIQELEKIKKQKLSDSQAEIIQIGTFSIQAMKLTKLSSEPVSDVYTVSIKKDASDTLTAELKETAINSGLYTAFIKANLKGQFLVEGIQVILEGSAFLNENGIGVMQRQTVNVESCCPAPSQSKALKKYEYFSFDIQISNVYALFDNMIAVDYSSEKINTSKSDQSRNSHEIYISLKGKIDYDDYENINFDSAEDLQRLRDRNSVKIYPYPLSHRDVLTAYYREPIGTRTYGIHHLLPFKNTKEEEVKKSIPTQKKSFSCSVM